MKTRTTGQGADLTRGLNGRFFFPTNPNPPPNPPNTCPPDQPTFVFGRNYWNPGDNMAQYGYQDATPPVGWPSPWVTTFHPNDPRLVTIFLTTSESFTGPGQEAYPVVGAVAVYITGYGHILGNGSPQIDDPCAGPLPSDADFSGGSSGERFVWGHIINHAVLSANATPSGNACNPGASPQVCVPVLVE